jgi:hypothetical protein
MIELEPEMMRELEELAKVHTGGDVQALFPRVFEAVYAEGAEGGGNV